MTAGTIGAWKAAPGNLLRPGDVLCEIETDKASVAFEVSLLNTSSTALSLI
jgi:pyruvate/2-oxoglutarate dehydrogenase complex dihydrolipoamide acyltransferase (E2) component